MISDRKTVSPSERKDPWNVEPMRSCCLYSAAMASRYPTSEMPVRTWKLRCLGMKASANTSTTAKMKTMSCGQTYRHSGALRSRFSRSTGFAPNRPTGRGRTDPGSARTTVRQYRRSDLDRHPARWSARPAERVSPAHAGSGRASETNHVHRAHDPETRQKQEQTR